MVMSLILLAPSWGGMINGMMTLSGAWHNPKRLENIESGRQRMHDEDFEKVCGTFPEFTKE